MLRLIVLRLDGQQSWLRSRFSMEFLRWMEFISTDPKAAKSIKSWQMRSMPMLYANCNVYLWFLWPFYRQRRRTPLSVYPIDNDCRRVARAQLASLFIWPKQRWARDPSLLIQALDNWHLRCYPLSFKTSQCSRIWVIWGPFLQSNKWVPWKPLDKEKHPYEDEWFTWLTWGLWVFSVCW